MNLVAFALRRPITLLVALLGLVLAAGVALTRMGRDIFPPLGIPTIYVAQPYGGMDPTQMEGYLTYYYEYHFLYITGIEHVESKSIQGASLMKLQFHPGTDMAQALAETIAYVNRARAFMPPGTVPPFVTRFDAGSVPVGYLVFSTDNAQRTVGQMQDAALNLVRPLFATLPGVSAPPPFGGSARTIVVNVKPDRLRAYQMAPDEVVTALSQANTISPSGNLNLGTQYPIVPVNAVARNIKDLESVPVRVTANGAVFLRDLATVEDGSDIVTSFALVNGRRTVYLPVTKRADASTLSVVAEVRRNLPAFQAVLPDDIRVTYEFDQAPVVVGAIDNLLREGALGAVLTGLMVLLFLRDWRSAIVVVVNIPLALLAAVFALWVSGQSINLMTLGGLALAVGILVDEATVAVENIHVHRARGRSLARAARDAIAETALPRLLAMLCILAVFIPAFFLEGAVRALFVPLALAVGFAMVASFLLSSSLVPILSIWWLRAHSAAGMPGEDRDSIGPLPSAFVRLLRAAMRWRWLVLSVYLGVSLLVLWRLAPRLGSEIFPASDAGQLALRLRAPAGTRIDVTESLALRALDLIKREAGPTNVALTMGLVGVHAPNYPVNLIHLWNGGPEEAHLSIQLRPGAPLHVAPFEEHLRGVFARELPGVRCAFEPSDIVSRVMNFGANAPIEIAVSGPNLATSRGFAERIQTRLHAIPSLRDIHFAQSLDFPTVDINVNRERAGLLGVKLGDVTRSLVPATTSSRFTVANYWADPNSGVSYNLQVQIPQAATTSLEDLQNVPVKATDGRTVLLRNIATITPGTAVGQYERYNMARVVSVTADLYGTDLGHGAQEISRALAEVGPPPPRTTVSMRGQLAPLEELRRGLQSGLLLTVVVIFLMLAAHFQSARLALVVLSTVPAVIAGVVVMCWLTRTTLNIQSGMGAIMAVGVAVANAILLVNFAERSRLGHQPATGTELPATAAAPSTSPSSAGSGTGLSAEESALVSARSRLRPILMTSCAMIAGMVPMALGLGAGGAQTAPLGRAVIGGLAAATFATLLVLPCVFSVLVARKPTRHASLDPDDPASVHYTPISGDHH